MKKNDIEVLDMLDRTAVSYQVVLTKVDKIKVPAVKRVTEEVHTALKSRPAAHPEVIATSSEKGEGIAELRAVITALTDR